MKNTINWNTSQCHVRQSRYSKVILQLDSCPEWQPAKSSGSFCIGYSSICWLPFSSEYHLHLLNVLWYNIMKNTMKNTINRNASQCHVKADMPLMCLYGFYHEVEYCSMPCQTVKVLDGHHTTGFWPWMTTWISGSFCVYNSSTRPLSWSSILSPIFSLIYLHGGMWCHEKYPVSCRNTDSEM